MCVVDAGDDADDAKYFVLLKTVKAKKEKANCTITRVVQFPISVVSNHQLLL